MPQERGAEFVPSTLLIRGLTREQRDTERARARLVIARMAVASEPDRERRLQDIATVWEILGIA